MTTQPPDLKKLREYANGNVQIVDDWRIAHFERARDFAKELGFSGITDALTELSALLKQCKVMALEGWKLVPVEPTDEMVKSTTGKWTPDTIWKAMLAAAPQPGAEVYRDDPRAAIDAALSTQRGDASEMGVDK